MFGFSMKRFLIRLTFLTLLIAAATYIAFRLLPPSYVTPALPGIILFFYVTTVLVHWILLKASHSRFERFVNWFMLLTVGKLILFLTLILVYSLINREDAVAFILAFSVLYVAYTLFEVITSLRMAGKRS
ncbi:MAG: hypothetical protein JW861_06895 [Bacteroidales bacterium]|nr:hypothetical protein [Bacteroidales bacterium]